MSGAWSRWRTAETLSSAIYDNNGTGSRKRQEFMSGAWSRWSGIWVEFGVDAIEVKDADSKVIVDIFSVKLVIFMSIG